jgi:hypothetical protein
MNRVIDKIEKDSQESIDHMNFISKHEDFMIEELDSIEKNVDKYLHIVSNRPNFTKDDNCILYEQTMEIERETKVIQSQIHNIQKHLCEFDGKNHNNDSSNTKKDYNIYYENKSENEYIDINVNKLF